ncbi:MAG: gentisate 1,2-dioxygenase [Candidatus Binatota bacterium]|nr:gentisate 1,2-dioxygenase [Candidatus Binatota bacterium]
MNLAGGATSELEAFYADVAALDLQPLWTQKRNLMPSSPAPAAIPWLWRWTHLRRLAERSGELIGIDRGGDRRVLALANPGLGGLPFTTPTLWAAVQYLGPGEGAPPHRHSPGAIRFVIEGESVWTTVDGDACDMHPGDLVLTPRGRWHDHQNGGNAPMIWFDGLDMPLVIGLDAMFYENHSGSAQPVRGRNLSERAHAGGGLAPVGRRQAAGKPESSPLLVYRREDTDAALSRALAANGGPIASLEFVNPVTGDAALPTLGCEMHRIAPGRRTPSIRRAGSSVWLVHRGRGTTVIGGERFEWAEGDVFAIPSWAPVDHQADELSDLFVISDRPVLEALGLYREKTLEEPQEVRGTFAPK